MDATTNGSQGRFQRIEEKLDEIQLELKYTNNRLLELEYAAKFEDLRIKQRVSERTYRWMITSIIASFVIGAVTLILRFVG